MSPRSPRRPAHTIPFVSDLHLEFERRSAERLTLPIHRRSTALVIAGDDHSDLNGLDSFIRPLPAQRTVILVAGNHIEASNLSCNDWTQVREDRGKHQSDTDSGASCREEHGKGISSRSPFQ